MATCFVGPDFDAGLDIFKEVYRTSGDFVKASDAALNHMKGLGFKIDKEQFNTIVENRFKDLIPKSDGYYRYRNGEKQQLLNKVHKLLGITGKLNTGKKGKFKVGKMSAEAQEIFEDVIDIAFKGKIMDTVFRTDQEVIGTAIKDGINYDDIQSLREAVRLLEQIQKEGKGELNTRAAEREAKLKENKEKIVEAVSRLNLEQQRIKKGIAQFKKDGTGDIEALVADFKKQFKYKGDISINDSTADRLLTVIAMKENTVKEGFWHRFKKSISQAAIWENFDLESLLNVLDRRGSATTDGGFLERFIHDNVRKADDKIRTKKDQAIEKLGQGLAKIYGRKIAEVKGILGSKNMGQIMRFIKEKATASNAKIETGVILPDGTPWTPSRGEVAQLWLDSFDPDVAKSIEAAGITMQQLRDAHEQLSQQEKDFAMFLQQEFYPYLYSQENPVYKKIYNINMPFNQVYGGAVSYQGDAETQVEREVSPTSMSDFKQTNVVLNNAIERTATPRAINLNRNMFSNVVTRIDNSAKFTGGAEIFNEIYPAWNSYEVRNEIKKANFTPGLHKKVNDRIEQTFGLNKKLTGIPKLVNNFTGNVTFASLALTPKLALNQITSAAFWFSEASTIAGVQIGKDRRSELGSNLKEILATIFDSAPILRERYKRDSIIGLASSIEETGITDLQYQGKLGRVRDIASWAAMLPTLLGDAGGVLVGGIFYYKGEYAKARAAGKSIEEAKEIAGYKFGKRLSKTQQSFQKIDKSELQNSPLRIFTMFQTTPRQFRRIAANSVRQLARGSEGKGTVGKNVANLAMYHLYAAAAYKFVMDMIPRLIDDEDDEEDWWKFGASVGIGSYFNSILWIGDVLEAEMQRVILSFTPVEYKADWKVEIGKTPAFQKIQKAYDSMTSAIKWYDKDDEKFMSHFIDTVGRTAEAVFALPYTKGQGIIDNFGDWEDGGFWDRFAIAMNYSKYSRRGGPEKKGKKTGFGNKPGFTNKPKGFTNKPKGFTNEPKGFTN